MRALLIILGVLVAVPAWAQSVGNLVYAAGEAQIVRDLKELPVSAGLPLESDDTLRVQIGARMKSMMDDDTIVMIWEDAEVRLENIQIDVIQGVRIVELEQVTGNMRIIASEFFGSTSRIMVRTPSARIQLDAGGDVIIRHRPSDDQTEVISVSGTPIVEHLFSDLEGTANLDPQQTTIITPDNAPSEPVFMDRQTFDDLVSDLKWTMPRPIVDWSGYFGAWLEDQGVESFGRIRRLTARPLQPVRNVSEGLSGQNVPAPPGNIQPEPFGTLEVNFTLSSGDGE